MRYDMRHDVICQTCHLPRDMGLLTWLIPPISEDCSYTPLLTTPLNVAKGRKEENSTPEAENKL